MNAENNTTQNHSLLLDIGNTNLKWAWLSNRDLGTVSTLCHKGKDIATLVAENWSNVDIPGQVYISSVASRTLETDLVGWIEQEWSLEPEFIRSAAETCGVINSYSEPERLGVDRWLSMIALHVKTPGPACVVDCGSAITIDVLGTDGRHLGGLILPGLSMMLQSLTENTPLRLESATKSEGLLATDTETAMAAGGVMAVAALVEQIQRDVAAESGAAVELVITGGDAALLHKALRVQSREEQNLVLQGVVEIINAREN